MNHDNDPASGRRRSGAASSYQGRYINLDRSRKRLDSIKQHLASLGVSDRYRRFPAIDGTKLKRKSPLTPGEVGIFASHLSVLDWASRQSSVTHVIEDDAVLSALLPSAVSFFEAGGLFDKVHVALTEMMIPPNLQALQGLKAQFDAATASAESTKILSMLDLIDLEAVNFSCMSSYLVSPRSARHVLPLCRREWDAGPTQPFDFFLRREARRRRIKAVCIFPFITSIDIASAGKSTSGRRKRDNDSELIMDLLRYSFFIDHDLQGTARTILADIVARADGGSRDPHREFLSVLLGLVTSSRFESF